MKITVGGVPGDAPASLGYASGNKSHVPCAGECVKLTPFTRCSKVLWALQGLLLSNTYFKKVNLACSEWKVLCVCVFFFFFFNLLGELCSTCLHRELRLASGCFWRVTGRGTAQGRQPGPDGKGQRPEAQADGCRNAPTSRHQDVAPSLNATDMLLKFGVPITYFCSPK